jgi:glycosyltransferase involved in cell wall biosynthesis
MSLSIIILTKNVEDEVLPALKTASKIADEIIIVDTGSTDATLKLVKPYASKVIKTTVHNFATWRNLGAQHATSDWLLYLDSDERLPKALAGEILATIKEPIHDAFTLPRYEIFLGKHLAHWPDPYVLRLIKKTSLVAWRGRLHEQPDVKGTIGTLKNNLIHLSHRNITQKLTNSLEWSKLEAKLLYQANHPKMKGWRLWRILATEFWLRFVKQGLWKDGVEGNIEVIYQMFSRFLTYVRLWEMQRDPTLKETYTQVDKKILQEWKS